jgi:hypothetical protein
MGIDHMAVVDPDLRVYGVEGLRVADASIMPAITSGNTNAPSVMIGEKCAELILSGLGVDEVTRPTASATRAEPPDGTRKGAARLARTDRTYRARCNQSTGRGSGPDVGLPRGAGTRREGW